MEKQEFLKIVESSYSISEVGRKIFGYGNSRTFKKIKFLIGKYDADTSHFGRISTRKYEIIKKVCPICANEFKARNGHPKEKMTCSYGCANTYFRSKPRQMNGNSSYRKICFYYHEKECVVCGEKLIVEVHHYDCDSKNNNLENLVPLCSNHHRYFHSRHRKLIISKIENYIENWKLNNQELVQ